MRALGGMLSPALAEPATAQVAPPFQIRAIPAGDALKVSILQTTVFDQPNEARMTISLRKANQLPLEIAAFQGGRMIAHLAAARMVAPNGWLAFLPYAVLDGFDVPGLRLEMILEVRRLARLQNVPVLVSTGDPAIFSECGFYYRNADMLRTPFHAGRTGLCPLVGTALDTTEPLELIYPRAILNA